MAQPKNKLLHRLRDLTLAAIPVLQAKGFERLPVSWCEFGYHPGIGYCYNLVRIRQEYVEIVEIIILYFDDGIIVKLTVLKCLSAIEEADIDNVILYCARSKWTNFYELRQRSFTDRLLGRRKWLHVSHKSEQGIKKDLEKIDVLLREDFENIDYFFEKWYEENTPLELPE